LVEWIVAVLLPEEQGFTGRDGSGSVSENRFIRAKVVTYCTGGEGGVREAISILDGDIDSRVDSDQTFICEANIVSGPRLITKS
jgi:hypothetical protein